MSQSYSKIDTYGKCPALFQYKYIRNLQLKRKDSNLYRGITAHDILKDWFLYQREHEEPYLEDPEYFIIEWLEAFFAEAETPEFVDALFDWQKEVEQVAAYVLGFLRLGAFDDWEVLHVEETFVVEINGEEVTFTPDLVARHPDGGVWIIDHKTSNKHLDRDALDIKPQALNYYLAVAQFYPDVTGFIFNYIRKKVPTQPRLNKTGKKAVTDLNRIDTTYELLYEFVKKNGLMDDLAHRRRLGELRDKDTFYFQHPMFITEDMLREAANDLETRLRLMQYSEWNHLYPRQIQPFDGCKKCEMHAICFTELTGGNTDIVLTWYEPREEKNPYEREDDE
jgi:hypothetical protein